MSDNSSSPVHLSLHEKAPKSDLQLGKGMHKGAVCLSVTYRYPHRGFSECAALYWSWVGGHKLNAARSPWLAQGNVPRKWHTRVAALSSHKGLVTVGVNFSLKSKLFAPKS